MKIKKRILSIALAGTLVLVLVLLPRTALAARADGGITHSGFTATGGTSGARTDEEYGSLVDGNKETKWCVTALGSPTYIEFHSAEAITPTGYILTTGGDTADYPGRNPVSWTIKAKVNENDADWTTLTTVTEDTVLGAKSTTDYLFALGNTAQYQYFRFEINSIKSGSVFQLAEFRFISGVDLYHDLAGYGTLTGTGYYRHTGSEITPLYTVKAVDGTMLTEGKDYSVAITKDGNTVATVQEKGDYVLKVMGISPYTGTKELAFTVGDGYKYIDTDDTEKNCESLTVLTGGGSTTLSSGWYVVNRNIEYSDTITINGDVHIILVNGKTLTVDTTAECFKGANSNDSLNIYAQSSGISAGTLNATTAQSGYARAVEVNSLVLNGGNINFYGKSDATVVETCKLAFNGGNVNIDGGEGRLYFQTNGFNFKWRSATDSFYAKNWVCNDFTFEKPVKCIDNSHAYSGTFHTNPNYSSPLDGKKLVPATLSKVTLADMSNGSVTKSDASLQSEYFDGETVTLSIAPESGYRLSSLNVKKTDDNTQVVPVEGSGNTRTFTMPAYPVTVTAVFVEITEPFEVTLEDFDTVFEEYAVPDAKTITLHSLSESVRIESVTIDNIEEFELNKTDGITLAAGGTDTSYTIWPKDGLTVGTHTAIVTINYGDSKTVKAETSFVVKPHELTVSAPGVSERDYVEGYTNTYQSIIFITNSGSEQKTISSVSLSGADADCFSLERRCESINIPAGNTDQSNYLIRPATGKSAGTYTAVLKVTCNDGETATTQVKFNVLSPKYDMSVTAPKFDLEYYDGYFPTKNVVITYTGNIETKVSSIKLEGTDADKFTMSGSLTEISPSYYEKLLVPSVYDREIYIQPKPNLPVGTYNAKITVVNSGGVSASDEFSFTVEKAIPVISELPVASEITYGQNLSESSLTGGIVKNNGKVVAGQFSWEKGTTEPAVSDGNSTEYKVLFTPTDTKIYETVSCNVKIKVNKADIVASDITTPTAKSLTYSGTAQELVTAGEAIGGTMQYALGTETEATQPYTTSIPAKTDAGTYYVWYKVVGDDNHSNTNADCVSVKISKKALTITANSDSKKYDGTALTKNSYTISENGLVEGDEISEVTITGTQTTAGSNDNVPNGAVIKNGDADVTDNYDISYVSGTLTVTKATPAVIAPIANILTYNGNEQDLVTAGSSTLGTVLYSLDGEKYSSDFPKAKDAGEYKIYYKVEGTDNWNAVEAASVNVIIKKATPLYDKPDDKEITCKQTLNDIALPDGFLFGNVNQKLSIGENEVKLTFTPEDTDNYEVINDITIKVTTYHTFDKEVTEEKYLKSAATCTDKAVYYKSCECGKKGTDTFEHGEALGHDYVDVTYTWSEDGKTCTATSICSNDSNHTVTETAKYEPDKDDSQITATVKEAATTEKMGTTTYTATFKNTEVFKTQTKDVVDIPKVEKADNPSDTPADTTTTTTPTDTATKPVPKEEGAKLPVADTKAEYVVTSKAGEESSVEYKPATDVKDKTVTVPETVTVDGVTYKVTKITNDAFKNNKSVETVVIPDTVTIIGTNAFKGCKKLKSATIGKNVTEIGNSAFAGCISLTKITISAKVTKLGSNMFKGCKNLKTIIVKTTKLTSKNIAKNAFKGVGNKVTIKVPKKMKKAYTKLFRKKGLSKKVKIK